MVKNILGSVKPLLIFSPFLLVAATLSANMGGNWFLTAVKKYCLILVKNKQTKKADEWVYNLSLKDSSRNPS